MQPKDVSTEDKQFLADLKFIQTSNNLKPVKSKKKSGKKFEKLSSRTNKPNSFKSVTSYVLGDLDIEKAENSDGSESFEISSNTSAVKSEEDQNEKDAVCSFLSSKHDASAQKPEINEANLLYKSFLSDRSPFSFKNPIFFSCP